MQQLNPFVVVGADYDRFNLAGELDLIDPDTGTGSLSDSWITDRSAMLAWFMKAATERNSLNSDDLVYMTNEISGYGWDFADRITGKSILVSQLGETPTTQNHKVAFGGEKDDSIQGDLQNDRLYGGGGADTIQGEDGNDYIEGGKGSDIITGGKGNDWIIGGSEKDTYIYTLGDGQDVIVDSGDNKVIIDNGSGYRQTISNFFKSGTETWTSTDGKLRLVHSSTWKIILQDGGSIDLGANWTDGDFGIHLNDEPAALQTGLTITGDLTPIDFNANRAGVQMQFDALGNVICSSDPMPGRRDYLSDGTGNERIEGKDGNDFIYQGAGDDLVLGGAGRDGIGIWLNQPFGNDLVVGGPGADAIYGGGGNDQLFGESQVKGDAHK